MFIYSLVVPGSCYNSRKCCFLELKKKTKNNNKTVTKIQPTNKPCRQSTSQDITTSSSKIQQVANSDLLTHDINTYISTQPDKLKHRQAHTKSLSLSSRKQYIISKQQASGKLYQSIAKFLKNKKNQNQTK